MHQQTLFDNSQEAGVSLDAVAKQLEVSVATVRNWIKTGYLRQISRGMVSVASVENFKNTVAGSEKLTARANKSLRDFHNHDELLEEFFSLIDRDEISGVELGTRYEEALSNAYRNKASIYYTPQDVTNRFFQYLPQNCAEFSFCDPCCGSGNFILSAIEHGISPDNVHGYDTDPFAVAVTKKRIFERTGYVTNNIHCTDFLEYILKPHRPCFDIIFTNPPWGKKISKNQKACYAKALKVGKSVDTSALFFLLCLGLLADSGFLGFLLQDAFFNIAAYNEARKSALARQIIAIIDFGKPFTGLLTKAKGIVIKNTKPAKGNIIAYTDLKTTHSRLQRSFAKNPKCILNAHTSQAEADAIFHLYARPHVTLDGKAKWGLGIVTGNNKKFVIDQPVEGYVAAYKGADIKKDGLANPTAFIPDNLSLYQQVAPQALYEAKEKLIYRFISSALIFFCDTQQRYILNSANLIIPDNDFPISQVQLSQILNSKVINWLFRAVFDTHKVLRSDIEALPIHVDYFNKNSTFDDYAFTHYLGLEALSSGAFRIKK